jgi:hypothetical protein
MPRVARGPALAERTGGNPFYVGESGRLLASEGALVATSEVPEGVRDVRRRRLARLPPAAVSVLRLAAEIGRIGGEHDLVAYRWCVEHIASQAPPSGPRPPNTGTAVAVSATRG